MYSEKLLEREQESILFCLLIFFFFFLLYVDLCRNDPRDHVETKKKKTKKTAFFKIKSL